MQTRDQILRSFNCDFRFAVTDDLICIQPGSDVFAAMAELLRCGCELQSDELLAIAYLVSVDGKRWDILPVGPAYRQCSERLKATIRERLTRKYGPVDILLTDGDVVSMDRACQVAGK